MISKKRELLQNKKKKQKRCVTHGSTYTLKQYAANFTRVQAYMVSSPNAWRTSLKNTGTFFRGSPAPKVSMGTYPR